MKDNLAWVLVSARYPQDRQPVYARIKQGQPRKVTFYRRPSPRWEGSSIVYDFGYFLEWAALDAERKPLARSR